MTRLPADLSPQDVRWPEQQATAQGSSRIAVIPDAAASYTP
jgi:hypothetical protein